MNKKTLLIFIFFALAAGLFVAQPPSATAKKPDPSSLPHINPEIIRDRSVERTISEWFDIVQGDQVKMRYYYNRVDLNGDRDPEVIVLVVGDLVCGSGGCETLILQREENMYRVVSDISLMNTPIIVSPHRTNGWNDLLVKVKGDLSANDGILPGYYVALRFNGREYPSNPTLLKRYSGKLTGTVYLLDSQSPGSGIILE